ncbi:MAG: hypothetical protein H6737_13320 [Alphaproteobacteria bacterium]|nr:hypothetical protein [Alphaproteobacteria bacterium]
MYFRLSRALRIRLDELRDRPPEPRDALRARVEAHVAAARKASQEGAPVDVRRAERIAEVCNTLLAGMESLSSSDQSLVKAACLYFADADDDEDDFQSMVGLEDDVQVLHYVLAQLGRDDLVLD